MAEKTEINYPDVLGFVSSEARHTVGPVQVAMALRPRIAKAGRPFEVIIMIQNMIDAPVDVTVTLQVPDKDAQGQKGRFLVGSERLVVGVEGAEAGYVLLPMTTLPDAAPADDYMIAIDIGVKALDKGETIRDKDGGSKLDPKSLPPEKQKALADIYNLKFTADKRGFLRSNTLETSLNLLAGKVGTPLKLEAGWHSLWTLGDQADSTILVDKYKELMTLKFIPELTIKNLHAPMVEKVKAVFEEAGFELLEIEATCIAKVMMLILEYAGVDRSAHAIMEAGIYNMDTYLHGEAYETEGIKLPRWFDKMLRAVAHDERIARVPVKATLHFAFYELLYDAMMYSFGQLERHSDEDLGTEEEMHTYAESMIKNIKDNNADFSTVYMPLITGGVISFDKVMLPNEHLSQGLEEFKFLLEERENELNDSTEMIFDITRRTIEQALKKYGSLDNRL